MKGVNRQKDPNKGKEKAKNNPSERRCPMRVKVVK
jgi:hypothetical protein